MSLRHPVIRGHGHETVNSKERKKDRLKRSNYYPYFRVAKDFVPGNYVSCRSFFPIDHFFLDPNFEGKKKRSARDVVS